MLSETAVEYVQRTVVRRGLHVINVILHLHLDAVSFVVLPAFEFLIPILFGQFAVGPFVVGSPVDLDSGYDDGLVYLFVSVDELLTRHVVHVDPVDVVVELEKLVEVVGEPEGGPGLLVV